MRNPVYRLVETDNYGGDYPNEQWACPYEFTSHKSASKIADAMNEWLCPSHNEPRYIIVVTLPYTLQPGFKP